MPEKSHETRIAVTESRLDSHAQMLENNQELTAKLVDRLDGHIQLSLVRDERIQENLKDVTVAVTKLTAGVAEATTTLKSIVPIVQDNNLTIVQWTTVKKTIIAVVAAVTMVVSGGWAVFTYVTSHDGSIPAIQQK